VGEGFNVTYNHSFTKQNLYIFIYFFPLSRHNKIYYQFILVVTNAFVYIKIYASLRLLLFIQYFIPLYNYILTMCHVNHNIKKIFVVF